MSFLHLDLIMNNGTSQNLPVTIIFNHSSDLLFIFLFMQDNLGLAASCCTLWDLDLDLV